MGKLIWKSSEIYVTESIGRILTHYSEIIDLHRNGPLSIKLIFVFAEKNMESLMMSDSPEIQRASSSWTFRQQQASQRWKEARPFHLKCLIQTQDVGQPFCSHCSKPAVVRWDLINVLFILCRLLECITNWCLHVSDKLHVYGGIRAVSKSWFND